MLGSTQFCLKCCLSWSVGLPQCIMATIGIKMIQDDSVYGNECAQVIIQEFVFGNVICEL